jgi:hypothetical protein
MGNDDSANTARRAAAERNLGRLESLATGAPGLVVAAIASEIVGTAAPGLPSDSSSAAVIAQLPGVVLWVWPHSAAPELLAGDLAGARAAFGEDTRAVLVVRPRARVVSAPMHGEVGARVEGVDAVPLVRAVGGLQEGELVVGVDLRWSESAEARATEAGFVRAGRKP